MAPLCALVGLAGVLAGELIDTLEDARASDEALLPLERPPLPEDVPAVRLVYHPSRFAPACPAKEEVRAGIIRRLGVDPFAEPAARIVVIAFEGNEASEHPSRARVELFDGNLERLGERILESDEGCAELVEAAALSVSIAVAPGRALAALPAREPRPIAPPPPGETIEVPPPPSPPPPLFSWLPEGTRTVVGGGGTFSFLLGPSSSSAAHVAVGFRRDFVELRLESRQHVPSYEDDLRLIYGAGVGTLLPCAQLPLFDVRRIDDLALFGCGAVDVGFLWAAGAYIGGSPYFGAGGRVGLSWEQPDETAARIWFQLSASLYRPVFIAINGDPPFTQESPVNGALGLTWETSWP